MRGEDRLSEAEIAGLDRRPPGWPTRSPGSSRRESRCPRTRAIAAAQREHSRAAGRLRGARENAEQAEAGFDESVAACTVTERALRRAAIDHALDPDRVDRVEGRDRRFEIGRPSDLTARHREESQPGRHRRRRADPA